MQGAERRTNDDRQQHDDQGAQRSHHRIDLSLSTFDRSVFVFVDAIIP
jgi:hypothetical protein